jgi:hypothetical protein
MSDTALRRLTGGGGPSLLGTAFDLAPLGYTQAEYALSGIADAYARTPGGIIVTERAEFTTRLLVRRPWDYAAFNGTVWIEWLNVSGGLDVGAEWILLHTELMRSGAAWVGVSAQQVGITGGSGLIGFAGAGLTGTDPERYGMLRHPGDRFSYDMYSQAGRAVRDCAGTILDGLAVKRVLATGGSQSAFRLSTYVNDIDETAQVYDGFLVHSRGVSTAPLDDDGPLAGLGDGNPVVFRDDLRVPVLCVESETDLVTLGYGAARQDDTDSLVLWEIAGTSHADIYTLVAGPADTGRLPIDELAGMWLPASNVLGMKFDKPVNAGSQHYVLNAAASHLDRWTQNGTRPPAAPRIEMRDGTFVTDEHGNARGGVRTPHVDVPTAALSGLGNEGDLIAFLCGSTVPFTAGTLRSLYPSRAAYLERFREATASAVAAGFILAADAPEITAIAAINTGPWN